MHLDSSVSHEPGAQVARLERYIAWAMNEVERLRATDPQSTRIRVLSDNTTAARTLLLTLTREKGGD